VVSENLKPGPASPSVALAFIAIVLIGTGVWMEYGSSFALIVAGLLMLASVALAARYRYVWGDPADK
jgi:hypothetical protein